VKKLRLCNSTHRYTRKKCKGEAVPMNAREMATASYTSHFTTTEKAVDIH
jgi:hypothetical protein